MRYPPRMLRSLRRATWWRRKFQASLGSVEGLDLAGCWLSGPANPLKATLAMITLLIGAAPVGRAFGNSDRRSDEMAVIVVAPAIKFDPDAFARPHRAL